METPSSLAWWWSGKSDIPDSAFLAWARAHRLLALLPWRAKQKGWNLPEEIRRGAIRERFEEAARQALAHKQLEHLAHVAQTLSIPIACVKGPVVAARYPDPAQRSYNDLDLLVAPEDVARLLEALHEAGYRTLVQGDRGLHLPPLIPAGQGYRLELHTALAHDRGRAFFTLAEVQEKLAPWNQYPGLLTLNAVTHLLYLIYHQTDHHQLSVGLGPLADVRFWTQDWEPGHWKTLHDAADTAGLSKSVGLTLALAAWFWNEPYPDAITVLFPQPRPDVLTLARQMVSGEMLARTPKFWRDLPDKSLKGWLSYAGLLLLGAPENRKNLTFAQRIGFYLRRPFMLIKHHGPTLWQLLRGERRSRAAWDAQQQLTSWLRE
ncbi:MAG: nucleotidyltransferase family protein [Anaerolineae bacterium]|nr:nucleotidyltransferase family protein [Anaerolineae bacterium]